MVDLSTMSAFPTPSSSPPAGWYQDPHGGGLRSWDGTVAGGSGA